ncbi:MAG: tellurite resistance TerB family protein [Thauera sp.]|nr:tellurite resistance TerB family protein [Thauera sp.]
MDFGKLIGQVLQQGMNQRGQARVNHSLGDAGLGGLLGQVLGAGGGQTAGGAQAEGAGGALGQILGSVLGGQGGVAQGGAARSGGADLGAILGGMLAGGGRGGSSAGGGLGGGLGGLLGSMLGGGQSGGSGRSNGAGMAILASLAMAALKNWQGGKAGSSAVGLMSVSVDSDFDAEQFSRLSSAELEELMLRAMISAAKADGVVDEDELQRIVGRLAEDGLSAEEKQFLVNELQSPLDLPGLIAAVPNEAVAAQVYAASLLAIELDNEAEYAYLRQLAQGLGLDPATVSRLHQLTGVST